MHELLAHPGVRLVAGLLLSGLLLAGAAHQLRWRLVRQMEPTVSGDWTKAEAWAVFNDSRIALRLQKPNGAQHHLLVSWEHKVVGLPNWHLKGLWGLEFWHRDDHTSHGVGLHQWGKTGEDVKGRVIGPGYAFRAAAVWICSRDYSADSPTYDGFWLARGGSSASLPSEELPCPLTVWPTERSERQSAPERAGNPG